MVALCRAAEWRAMAGPGVDWCTVEERFVVPVFGILVSNYREITAVTAVITAILDLGRVGYLLPNS